MSAPLEGIKVVDIATLGAGPWLATRLADFGADVIKVEHPTAGDPLRLLGWFDGDVPLWWKIDSRNKRCITADLKQHEGQEIVRRLVRDADVLVENFRPGTLERWNLGYEDAEAREPPADHGARDRAGGRTAPTPIVPASERLRRRSAAGPISTASPRTPRRCRRWDSADAVTSVLGAYATMVALYNRDLRGGEGQVVDLAIYESLFSLIGQQVIVYDRLGVVPQRTGNTLPFVAPRNVYRTKDGRYVALAASTPVIWERVARAIGRPELIDDERFVDNQARLEHAEELDEIIGAWMLEQTQQEIVHVFEGHEAAVAPVYDIAQIFEDPHFAARGAIVTVEDDQLGPTRTADVFPRLSRTPGAVRHLGPRPGTETDEVLQELGYTSNEIEQFRSIGAV